MGRNYLLAGSPGDPGPIQAAFVNFPQHLQFYARDSQDSAEIPIVGTLITDTPTLKYDTLSLDLRKGQALVERVFIKLQWIDNHAGFSFRPKIHCELSEYGVNLSLRSGENILPIASRDSIVCGDAYIITGQSLSHPSDSRSTYSNEFCRTLGIQNVNQNYGWYHAEDTLWGFGNGHGFGQFYAGPYLVGVWGIRLQQLIRDNYKVPTCVLNGGAGGSNIDDHIRNDSLRDDIRTIYGKLLYRTEKAGLTNKIKAIFWSQGVSDTYDSSIFSYPMKFGRLYNWWKEDYPGVAKVYVFQDRPSSCSGGMKYQQELREFQRVTMDLFKDVEVMSLTGVQDFHGCHFGYDGYLQMAEQIYNLLARDFYGSSDTLMIQPADIVRAYYQNSMQNEIDLIFKNGTGITYPLNSYGHSILEAFYLSGKQIKPKAILIGQNNLRLEFDQSLDAKKISYLPARSYEGFDSTTYQGPFFQNSRGIGMLSFHNFPIETVLTRSPLGVAQPGGATLFQNYPNPFNSATVFSYYLPNESDVDLSIYDALGRLISRVYHGKSRLGFSSFQWSTDQLSSGVYLVKLRADNFSSSKKILFVK